MTAPPRRLALAAGAAFAAALLAGSAGCLLPDDRPRVSIEFGMAPELLEDRPVVIDGEPVGKLERIGRATRVSFPVEKGEHEVAILHPTYRCEPRRVDLAMAGQKVRLMAELQERYDPSGRFETVIVLR